MGKISLSMPEPEEPQEPQNDFVTAEEFKPLYRSALQDTVNVLAQTPVQLVSRAQNDMKQVVNRGE